MKYIEKATQIISDHITPLVEADATNPDTWGEPATPQEEAQGVTQALTDAGLLMPDLPASNFASDSEKEWNTLDGYVNLNLATGIIHVFHDERTEGEDKELAPELGTLKIRDTEQARHLARALLAAANHAEEQE